MAIDTRGEPEAFSAFVQELKEQYRPERILLFGSRAREAAKPDSDYDLLVVSAAFEGTPLTDRATPIYRRWPLWAGLDCLCLTPAEFDRSRKRISIVREIDREGVPL
jgi:predicted nucleotidyltransferase